MRGGRSTRHRSNASRNDRDASTGQIISLTTDFFGDDIFGGLKFRRELEQQAFSSVQAQGGTKQLPTQDVLSFLNNTNSTYTKSSSPSGATPIRMDKILPDSIYLRLVNAFENFDRKMKGFISPKAQLHGMETRTSCPVRVPRDKDSLESTSHEGLYPVGEGAGYAGGIVSAALDGLRCADAAAESIKG